MRASCGLQVMSTTVSMILLPLNQNRRQVEYIIENFYELVRLYNPKQYLDERMTRHF